MRPPGVSRRGFLSGRLRGPDPIRPPWAIAEGQFTHRCSRCDRCIAACPEAILMRGDGGFPEVSFDRGECTFCAKCLDACTDQALARIFGQAPWPVKAEIRHGCVAARGVVCRSCLEQCEPVAIGFRNEAVAALAEGIRASVPHLEPERCTGCGACVRTCPVGAIRMAVPIPPSEIHR